MKHLIIAILILGGVFNNNVMNASVHFPKMNPVQKAVFVSVGGAAESPEALHACRIFQGILNRDSAEVFLSSGDKELDWFKYLNVPYKRPDKGVITTGSNRGLRTLFRTYKDRLDKLVVCNFANNDYTFNMALLMACAEDVLPVSETLKNELIAEFGWDKEIIDIRNRWTSSTQAYDWALEELMPRLNKNLVFSIGLRDDWRNGGWRIYDYAVASRSFAFWVDDETTTGKTIIKKILNTPGYPKNAVVMGYGMHGDDLNLTTNPEGFGFVVSDLFPNASYYSSFPSETFEGRQPQGKAVPAQTNTIYVALHWSDGDNIQFNHNATYDIWKQSARGKVPVSMTMSPALTEMAPFILKYYYDTRTENDELMGGPSGVQYIQEPFYKPDDFESWCVMNGEYLKRSGMHSSSSSLRWPAQPFYNNGFVKTGVTGTLAWSGYNDAYNWCGMPVVCTGGVVSDENGIYNYLKGLSSRSDIPVFTGVYMVQAGLGGAGYAAINRAVERLQSEFPGKYVFQKASDLLATAKEYFTSQQQPFKQLSIPGRIEAEDFDQGGQGAGFYDMSRSNEGGEYRNGSGDYVGISKLGSDYFVGWTSNGEWLNYTVDIDRSSTYQMTLRYSTPKDRNKGICIMLDDHVLSTVELKATAGNDNYADHIVRVVMPEGKHNLRLQIVNGGLNIDYCDFQVDDAVIPKIEADKWYKIIAIHSNKALAIKTNNTTNGTKIVQKEYRGDDTQIWKLNVAGDACYGLQNAASGLNIVIRGTTSIGQYPFECTSDNGKWNLYYQEDGSFTIALKGSLKNLQIANASMDEGAELAIGEQTTGMNQRFKIEEVVGYSGITAESIPNASAVTTYPNPFVDEVRFSFVADHAQPIDISWFDLTGRCVTKKRFFANEGAQELTVSGVNLPTGIYTWRLAGEFFQAKGHLIRK